MRDQIFDRLHKWLYIDDEIGIDCILATAISALMPGDPLWMFVVAPPGGTKTELIRGFKGEHTYSVDVITPQALLSGFRGKEGETVDILNDLDKKLLVIKDFTAMLSKPQRVRDETFGRLRAAYDGSLEGAFGSGVKKVSREATFGILAAVTPIIDHYSTVHSLLGERFIRVRTSYDRIKSTRGALKHLNKEIEMRLEISNSLQAMMTFYSTEAKDPAPLKPETVELITSLADFTAIIRTGVSRNFRNEVTAKPEPEIGTRLGLQLSRLAQSLNILGAYSYNHLRRVARDSVPKSKLDIIMQLRAKGLMSTGQLMASLRLPRHVALSTCGDLEALDVIEDVSGEGGKNQYRLSDAISQTMDNAKL